MNDAVLITATTTATSTTKAKRDTRMMSDDTLCIRPTLIPIPIRMLIRGALQKLNR